MHMARQEARTCGPGKTAIIHLKSYTQFPSDFPLDPTSKMSYYLLTISH